MEKVFSNIHSGLDWTILITCVFIIILWIALTSKCILTQKHIKWITPSLKVPTANKLISVIIPARNEEKDIKKSLDSILNQCYTNLEVIIINDHSTDKTGDIIDKIA